MPAPNDIQPFIERLVRDPGAALVDEAFARAFNRLPMGTRRAIMERVEAERAQNRAATTREVVGRASDAVRAVRPEEQALDRVNRPVRPLSFVTMNFDDVVAERRAVDPAENRTRVVDESSHVVASPELARAARIELMRRGMAREIDEYRTSLLDRYEQLPAHHHTMAEFQAWSRNIEQGVSGIRARWEGLIEREERQGPAPPVVAWPDPTLYGPGWGYRSQRGALSAFTRAVNTTYGMRAAGGVWEEERDRIHINGTMEVRSLWRGWQEMPRYAGGWRDVLPETPPNPPHWTGPLPPPPTTQPWQDEASPEVDETDVMIKHLPRAKEVMVVVPTLETLVSMKHRLLAAGISDGMFHVHTVSMMTEHSRRMLRNLGYPVFIDPAVFKMHAARQGDWSESDLDAVIELQGQIPDEEPT